jgi:hypothetical protein
MVDIIKTRQHGYLDGWSGFENFETASSRKGALTCLLTVLKCCCWSADNYTPTLR